MRFVDDPMLMSPPLLEFEHDALSVRALFRHSLPLLLLYPEPEFECFARYSPSIVKFVMSPETVRSPLMLVSSPEPFPSVVSPLVDKFPFECMAPETVRSL